MAVALDKGAVVVAEDSSQLDDLVDALQAVEALGDKMDVGDSAGSVHFLDGDIAADPFKQQILGQ